MRVLVCGGRDYDDRQREFEVLSKLHLERGITAIIHGDATGADTFAVAWIVNRHLEAADLRRPFRCEAIPFPADWKKHGKAAGPIRNQRMLDEGKPDLVLAFPGGKGTADMVNRARKAGVPVQIIEGGESDG